VVGSTGRKRRKSVFEGPRREGKDIPLTCKICISQAVKTGSERAGRRLEGISRAPNAGHADTASGSGQVSRQDPAQGSRLALELTNLSAICSVLIIGRDHYVLLPTREGSAGKPAGRDTGKDLISS
jgi:hypothetical protein